MGGFLSLEKELKGGEVGVFDEFEQFFIFLSLLLQVAVVKRKYGGVERALFVYLISLMKLYLVSIYS